RRAGVQDARREARGGRLDVPVRVPRDVVRRELVVLRPCGEPLPDPDPVLDRLPDETRAAVLVLLDPAFARLPEHADHVDPPRAVERSPHLRVPQDPERRLRAPDIGVDGPALDVEAVAVLAPPVA